MGVTKAVGSCGAAHAVLARVAAIAAHPPPSVGNAGVASDHNFTLDSDDGLGARLEPSFLGEADRLGRSFPVDGGQVIVAVV